MPELPEVESLRRSLHPLLVQRVLGPVNVREGRLRYPVDRNALRRRLPGRRITDIRRRSKYLLFDLDDGAAMLAHLGMTGRLAVVPADEPFARHDHVILGLDGRQQLRFNDARRFGMVDYVAPSAEAEHRLLRSLGLEPLEPGFSGRSMHALARGRRAPIKAFLMDARRVVGVGNIYASEALFMAGIHPRRAAGRISLARWESLAAMIRQVLRSSIRMGGTTLRDYLGASGDPGRFSRSLRVYGRGGEPCRRCRRPIRRIVQSGRSTFYCPGCQI